MPFSLTNVPTIFLRLIQKVLEGVNTMDGQGFADVYINAVLVFSADIHEECLHVVLDRLLRAGLKLESKKSHFVCQLIGFHVIMPESYCQTLTS